MASIVDPPPDGNTQSEPTPRAVAQLMINEADRLTAEVGGLVSYIAVQHEHPVTCDECRLADGTPCLMLDYATSIVIAWLMQRAGL